MVEGGIGYQAIVGLLDGGVLSLVVGTAVGVGLEVAREGFHEGGAGGEDDVAGGVEELGDGRVGFRGGEEGHGRLRYLISHCMENTLTRCLLGETN